MRILFSVHLYPPQHNCGGEYYLHNMAKYLISKGHEIRVLLHQGRKYGIDTIYEHEGVTVFPAADSIEINLCQWADILVTHLEYTLWTIHMGSIFKKPVVQVVHNDSLYDCVLASIRPLNIIYNSQWIADKLHYNHRSMVLPPPVDFRHYDVNTYPSKNRYITLINTNKNKGGNILYQIARRLPDHEFLGVIGSYDDDNKPGNPLPNLTLIPNTSDILPVYRQTRVLLMPSKYESWGMTATEAMCNGIPVICTRTPGLVENTGGKMLYCRRSDIEAWIYCIEELDDPDRYLAYSLEATGRSRELDPLLQYPKLENFLYDAV